MCLKLAKTLTLNDEMYILWKTSCALGVTLMRVDYPKKFLLISLEFLLQKGWNSYGAQKKNRWMKIVGKWAFIGNKMQSIRINWSINCRTLGTQGSNVRHMRFNHSAHNLTHMQKAWDVPSHTQYTTPSNVHSGNFERSFKKIRMMDASTRATIDRSWRNFECSF